MLVRPITPNMNISKSIIETNWDNFFMDTVQKIAVCSVIPFSIIVFMEAVLKNMLFTNVINLTITLFNGMEKLSEPIREYAFACIGY